MSNDFQADIDAIGSIPAVTTILDVVRQSTGMGFVAVARVTEQRWVACEVLDDIDFGLKIGNELKIETTICQEIRHSLTEVAIDNVAEDTIYVDHHTPRMYGFQSYISTPIILADGSFFGTLCAIDPKPAKVNNPQTIGMFRLFAELIAHHLNARHYIETTEAKLESERSNSELREQFIAVLGHDLRNPLASITAGLRMLGRKPMDEKSTTIVEMMQQSVSRMANLIDNVLDFARGRLGSGLVMDRSRRQPLKPILEQVVSEIRSIYPERTINADIETLSVDCDPGRIGQLLSNLIGNAVSHGAADRPIAVEARLIGETFELSVKNEGDPIASDVLNDLFKPFVRASARPHQQGLGLGLYIASEIARAHNGRISVHSTPEETRFTLRMPATAAIP